MNNKKIYVHYIKYFVFVAILNENQYNIINTSNTVLY